MAFPSLKATASSAILFLASSIWCVDAAGASAPHYVGAGGQGACPVKCSDVGYDPVNWSRHSSMEELQACDYKPKLLDFNLQTPLGEDDTHFVVRACSTVRGPLVYEEQHTAMADMETDDNIEDMDINLELLYTNSDQQTIPNQKVTAVREIQASLLLRNDTETEDDTAPASHIIHYGDTVVGVFVGSTVDPRSAAIGPLEDFLKYAKNPDVGNSSTIAVQMCGEDSSSDDTMGFIADTTPGEALFRVQSAMEAWSNGECATGLGQSKTFGNPKVGRNKRLMSVPSEVSPDDDASAKAKTCRAIQVKAGQGCPKLAKRCGIKGFQLENFNPDKNFCSTLVPGQWICCSKGKLPDKTPKPKPDGTCASHVVKKGDTCAAIAAANSLKVKDIKKFNKKTWGWSGCNNLYIGINMCLSKGYPGFPASIKGAECGPQVPGTKPPKPGTDFTKMNPCPLNACCNVWGKCGTTADFCTKASLGPPGTSEPGKNGCIQNCGTKIVNNDKAPSQFIKLGYFEAWNKDRPCLHMDVDDLPAGLTHVHFAFGDVGPGYSVSTARVRDQFQKFKSYKGAKRIIAFGGWTASTNPNSYWIFREGVKPGNREILAENLVKFVVDNNLDGIDLDWEYPGAPDIPGIPSADPLDGNKYLELLKLIRAKLPGGKSLSIAAPASYWYLKQFPMGKIAKVVDYIVYMTYDLHGQWDWGNEWANPGCPKGNCLRSHVNITETMNSLAMITKAGVPASKVIVGVTSYGRSFRMVDKSCTGPQCKFTGPESGAKGGICTKESGYLANAEIKAIINKDPDAKTFYDEKSMSNILVYGKDWVAYMDSDNKAKRRQKFKGLNFGGTTDWAVDLDPALSVVLPPTAGVPMPDHPGNDWKKIGCKNPYAMNETRNEWERWDNLQCEEAWEAAVYRWNLRDKDIPLSFSEFISNEFSGPVNMQCHITNSENGCDPSITCGDTHGLKAGPALILRSMGIISTLYITLYNGVNDAHNSIESTLEDFADTFSPPKEVDEALLGFLSFLSTGLGLVSGPVFGKALGASTFFTRHENAAETFEGSVMGIVDYGLGQLSKSSEGTDGLPTKELAVALAEFTRRWKRIITDTQESIFSGSQDGNSYLYNLMDEGKLIHVPLQPALDVENHVRRTLFAHLIPYAWSLRDVHPVLIDSGWDCDSVGVMDYEEIIPKDSDDAKICIDENQYYLVHPEGPAKICKDQYPICDRKTLSVPPGLGALGEDGKRFGGITKYDIAKAILRRYKVYGNKHLDDRPDIIDDEDSREELWDVINEQDGDSALMRGIVRLPTCSAETVSLNWIRETLGYDVNTASYPCGAAP